MIRFWHRTGDKFVRLSLKPGGCLHWNNWERTDEGYVSSSFFYRHDKNTNMVYLEIETRSQDCDGRYYNENVFECSIEKLNSKIPMETIEAVHNKIKKIEERTGSAEWWEMFLAFDEYPERLPEWRMVKESHRDFTAEAAGY